MRVERVEWVVRRRDDLDAEPLEQGAWRELRLLQPRRQFLERVVSVKVVPLQVEKRGQLVGDPVSGRRSRVEVSSLDERPPEVARVSREKCRDVGTVRVKHARHVVIMGDQQFGGVRERLVRQ
jgi:hypothetical protein